MFYKDAAKDDQVAVIAAAYSADENNVIVKLDTVSGKVDAVKTKTIGKTDVTTEARINGTWYDVAVFDSKDKVAKDDKGDFFVYNGYIVAVDTTGGSISDTAYIISSSTSMDVEGNYQAKVMMNGETKVVSIHKDSAVNPKKIGEQGKVTVSAIEDKYVTYEVKDGAYKFTEITTSSSGLDNYSAAQVNSYKDGRIYANAKADGDEYLIDDNAVVYVKYNNDKYTILSGKDVAGWGDKVKEFKNNSSLVLYETKDSMKKIKGAFIDLDTAKMPASTASYGVIVSDIVSATDDKNEFTLWNGTDTIEVTTSDSGFAKWQVVEYVKNSDDTYDIDAVAVNGQAVTSSSVLAGVVKDDALYSIMDHTSNVVQLANDKLKAKNYNITKDTQIIYVDTSASDTDGICVKGGSISDAGYAGKNDQNKDTYYRNATFVIDDGSDLDLLVVITNTKDAYSGILK